jgi:hypothetical protein
MKNLKLFAQLAKIDEARREVWGVATAEVVDKEGEIFDYESSKPYFKAWSAEIEKATDGKSLGNVREMHTASAVGKLISLSFDDEQKQIQVGAKIVDDAAWKKCMDGVYTGFSIGGCYVKAWKDGEFTRFTADPAEISVVDNPCVPMAHFTAVKADGSSEIRKFKTAATNGSGAIAGFGATSAGRTLESRSFHAPYMHRDRLNKDMDSVSSLAALLQAAVALQQDSNREAQVEGDGSPVPADLRQWIEDGAAILSRMTEEEIAELTASLNSAGGDGGANSPGAGSSPTSAGTGPGAESARAKFNTTSRLGLGKRGAKHSAETRAHHEAIRKALDGINQNMTEMAGCYQEADQHMNALMGKDDGMEAATRAQMHKDSPATAKIQMGEQPEMLELYDKLQLEKARANSAEALSKIAELEKAVGELKTSQDEIAKSLGNIAKAISKLAGVDEGESRRHSTVARTVVPTATVTKADDQRGGEREPSEEELGKMTPDQRAHYEMVKAFQNPQKIAHTPVYLRTAQSR